MQNSSASFRISNVTVVLVCFPQRIKEECLQSLLSFLDPDHSALTLIMGDFYGRQPGICASSRPDPFYDKLEESLGSLGLTHKIPQNAETPTFIRTTGSSSPDLFWS